MLSSRSKTGVPAKRHSGLKLGQLSGDLMLHLQAKLGLQTDGEFDPRTEKALTRSYSCIAMSVSGPTMPSAVRPFFPCQSFTSGLPTIGRA